LHFLTLLEKETIPYQNQKDSLLWGKHAAGMKATAGNGWINGMGRGLKERNMWSERMELLMPCGAKVDA
jgi:hypothetical protein